MMGARLERRVKRRTPGAVARGGQRRDLRMGSSWGGRCALEAALWAERRAGPVAVRFHPFGDDHATYPGVRGGRRPYPRGQPDRPPHETDVVVV